MKSCKIRYKAAKSCNTAVLFKWMLLLQWLMWSSCSSSSTTCTTCTPSTPWLPCPCRHCCCCCCRCCCFCEAHINEKKKCFDLTIEGAICQRARPQRCWCWCWAPGRGCPPCGRWKKSSLIWLVGCSSICAWRGKIVKCCHSQKPFFCEIFIELRLFFCWKRSFEDCIYIICESEVPICTWNRKI